MVGAGVVTGGEVVGAEVVLSANVVPGAGVPPFPPDPESELLPPPQAASSPLVIAANVKARLALFTGEITEATAGFSHFDPLEPVSSSRSASILLSAPRLRPGLFGLFSTTSLQVSRASLRYSPQGHKQSRQDLPTVAQATTLP